MVKDLLEGNYTFEVEVCNICRERVVYIGGDYLSFCPCCEIPVEGATTKEQQDANR